LFQKVVIFRENNNPQKKINNKNEKLGMSAFVCKSSLPLDERENKKWRARKTTGRKNNVHSPPVLSGSQKVKTAEIFRPAGEKIAQRIIAFLLLPCLWTLGLFLFGMSNARFWDFIAIRKIRKHMMGTCIIFNIS